MNIYFLLAFEFFKVGLFSIGGGLATIPFLYDMADKYTWITPKMISDMIAIAESTPGPLGINAATYVGYSAGGIPGGIIASLAMVTPALVIIIIIAKTLKSIDSNPYVVTVFAGVRPVVTALIAVVALQVFSIAVFDSAAFASGTSFMDAIKIKQLILFAVLFLVSLKSKLHPIIYIGIAAAAGILFKM